MPTEGQGTGRARHTAASLVPCRLPYAVVVALRQVPSARWTAHPRSAGRWRLNPVPSSVPSAATPMPTSSSASWSLPPRPRRPKPTATPSRSAPPPQPPPPRGLPQTPRCNLHPDHRQRRLGHARARTTMARRWKGGKDLFRQRTLLQPAPPPRHEQPRGVHLLELHRARSSR